MSSSSEEEWVMLSEDTRGPRRPSKSPVDWEDLSKNAGVRLCVRSDLPRPHSATSTPLSAGLQGQAAAENTGDEPSDSDSDSDEYESYSDDSAASDDGARGDCTRFPGLNYIARDAIPALARKFRIEQANILVTGIFSAIERPQVEEYFASLGARMRTSISPRTRLAVVGIHPTPSKVERLQQYQTLCLTEREFHHFKEHRDAYEERRRQIKNATSARQTGSASHSVQTASGPAGDPGDHDVFQTPSVLCPGPIGVDAVIDLGHSDSAEHQGSGENRSPSYVAMSVTGPLTPFDEPVPTFTLSSPASSRTQSVGVTVSSGCDHGHEIISCRGSTEVTLMTLGDNDDDMPASDSEQEQGPDGCSATYTHNTSSSGEASGKTIHVVCEDDPVYHPIPWRHRDRPVLASRGSSLSSIEGTEVVVARNQHHSHLANAGQEVRSSAGSTVTSRSSGHNSHSRRSSDEVLGARGSEVTSAAVGQVLYIPNNTARRGPSTSTATHNSAVVEGAGNHEDSTSDSEDHFVTASNAPPHLTAASTSSPPPPPPPPSHTPMYTHRGATLIIQ
eukprot:TRINITY_DN462_c0_g1_i2.p1 TRINITY_DN462_c0_g1~~TRINITY_DN462_c0_g1_i2.p1  ORF type:complete len:561 (-),score=77.64 TRINITY_DN462_c0_g1_i2:304-1986(-)